MSLERRRRLVRSPASASCWSSRTTRTGCCATRASRCRRCARSTAASSSSTWAPSRRSSRPVSGWAGRGAAAGAGEDEHRQGRRPVLVVVTQHFVRRLLRAGRLAGLPADAERDLPAAARRDARGAAEHFPPRRPGRSPRAGCSSGPRCPTTSTRPTCWRARCAENVAFVPGRAAYLDGRGGTSMRLNFSGVGRTRSARACAASARSSREQVGLYGTLTGAPSRPLGRPRRPTPAPADARAAAPCDRAGAAALSRVAVLKGGRSLERQVSLRSARRVEDALERLGHEVTRSTSEGTWSPARETSPTSAFVALHGRDGEDGTVQELLEILGLPYTGSGRRPASAAWTRS